MINKYFLILIATLLIGGVLAVTPIKNNSSEEIIIINYTDGSCLGDSCNLNSSNNFPTYEENLNDPKCFFNLNFCNLNLSNENVTSNAQNIINILKQVNYQMQDELNNTNTKLSECTEKINNIPFNKTTSITAVIAMILMGLWAGYLTWRKHV